MHVAFSVMLGALILFPVLPGFSAEFVDTNPTLTVMLDNNSPYVSRDSDGYVMVVGQVINNSNLEFVTNVQIRVDFYDETSTTPLESNNGSTMLEVIPPMGSSPYMIKSKSTSAAITQVSVDLVGFDHSSPKLNQLTVQSNNVLYADGMLFFSGILKNVEAPIHDTNVYVALYDNFDPPRIIGIHAIPFGTVLPNETISFDFNKSINPRAAGFYLFSESDVFYSDIVDTKLQESITMTKLVTIKSVTITDNIGNQTSDITVGSVINIRGDSWIRFSADQPSNETQYTYYVQVKQLGQTPYVEFIGKYDGRHAGANTQSPSVDWIPTNKGAFFIETFIWDRSNVPIANPGPIVLINVT